MRKDETFACKTFRLLEQNAVFWQRPTFNAKFQSLERQISQFQGHFENCLGKNEKNRIASNKCDICTLDIMTDFHWKHEANRWRSEICLIRSYADSLLKSQNYRLITCRNISVFNPVTLMFPLVLSWRNITKLKFPNSSQLSWRIKRSQSLRLLVKQI